MLIPFWRGMGRKTGTANPFFVSFSSLALETLAWASGKTGVHRYFRLLQASRTSSVTGTNLIMQVSEELERGHHEHRPYWKRAHHDWRFWVALVLMLAAMF